MIQKNTLSLIQNKFRESNIDISIENLKILIDGTGVWRRFTNEAHPDKKNSAGIISTISGQYINVSVNDFHLNVISNWQSHQDSEQKDFSENLQEIKKKYDSYKNTSVNNILKHPYADNKKLDITEDAFLRLDEYGNLIIPITQNGIVTGIQLINKKSEKRFLKNSLSKSAYLCYKSTKKNNDKIYFCEGWADGKHIHNITGDTVYICFSVNQIYNVVSLIKSNAKFKELIVVADNDVHPDRKNVGVEAALKCAKHLQCKVVIPPPKLDISDLFIDSGEAEVLNVLNNAQTYAQYNKTEQFNLHDNFLLDDKGVFLKKEDNIIIKLSTPIRVTAQTCDKDGDGWGRVVEVMNNNREWRAVEISIENLISSPKEVLACLGGNGAIISPISSLQNSLIDYIQNCKPDKMTITTKKTGWIENKNTFVGYNKCYGLEKDKYIFRGHNSGNKRKNIESKGTLEQWNKNIAMQCSDSSRLLFALCLGFTAPILKKLERQGFNIHFYGISSIGKSTLGQVASSIYGNWQKFMESWKTTANALEGIALAHNDLLLVLDEISQASEHVIIDSIYMLANGEGKSRSTKTGENRETNNWRTIGISNGEASIIDIAHRQKSSEFPGGVDVRMVDIHADVGENCGIFSKIPDSKERIDLLKHNVNKFYGTAGEAWIEYIAKNAHDLVLEYHKFVKNNDFKLDMLNKEKDKYLRDQLTEQANRVFKNFEIVAFVAKIISQQGIIKESVSNLHAAILTCFENWLENRCGGKNREKNELIKRCKEKISQNTYSKFLFGSQKPLECWGSIQCLDQNGEIVVEKDDQYGFPSECETVYFISCTAFDTHFRGNLTRRQALKWLDEEKMIRFQNKQTETLKKQGKYSWLKKFQELPNQSYYVIQLKGDENENGDI